MKILTGHIEELVLTALLKEGPLKTSDLLEKAFRKNQYTKQGVYRVLRKLRFEEKVVIYKSVVSINNFWREQLQSLLSTSPLDTSVIGDARGLENGDRLSLKLRGLSAADQVWSHCFISVEREVPHKHPLFLYNPHNWTSLLREETDRVHAERLERSRRPMYLVVGSAGGLDKVVTQALKFRYFEYSFNSKIKFPFSIAIIADYIFQMSLLGEGNAKVDSIFKSTQDPLAGKEFLTKIDRQIVCRIVIENDRRKAILLKKRLGRDFYIPKQHRDF